MNDNNDYQNKWIRVKEKRPENDCVCLVVNEKIPFSYYISTYNKYFDEFEVSVVASFIRLPDSLTFNATHWMKIPQVFEE